MKNAIKYSKKGIVMVTLFTTLLSFANENSFFTIKNDVKKTALTLKSVKEGNQLSIIDNNGIILYQEVIEKTGIYNKEFNLTSLPDGAYIFELDKDLEINTIPFTIKSNIVLFEKEKGKTIFKPLMRVKDDIVYVSKLSFTEQPLKIEIYFTGSNGSELMFSETIENTKVIERIFKLDGLKFGSYKLVFHVDGREFIKYVN